MQEEEAAFHHLPMTQASTLEDIAASLLMKTYIVSDVHLNDHPYDRDKFTENPRRRHFREFLTRLNQTHQPQEVRQCHKIILVLNGDIVDFTGSWFGPVLPWDKDQAAVESVLIETLLRIMSNNQAIIQELQNFLSLEHAEIQYVIGNHDGMFQYFEHAQSVFKNYIAQNDPEKFNRIHFSTVYTHQDLSLYVEHGHRFDRFNDHCPKQPYPFGDYINILLINRFVEKVVTELNNQAYSAEVIAELRDKLHEIEYLRPLSLIPLWIRSTADQYQHHPENAGKPESIDSILLSVAAEIVDANATRPLVDKLNLPRKFMAGLLNWWIHLPGSLPIVSFLVSHIFRKGHSNQNQYKMALACHTQQGYNFIAYGHTHVPGVSPLSSTAYFFNTGTWKPVINLFKHPDIVEEAHLEYLTPNVRFNKIDNSGILLIEKDFSDPALPPRFSLETIRSGV